LGALGEARGWGAGGVGFGVWALEMSASVASATAIVILDRKSDMDTSRIFGVTVGVASSLYLLLSGKNPVLFCVVFSG
jgi:hypothetical protein